MDIPPLSRASSFPNIKINTYAGIASVLLICVLSISISSLRAQDLASEAWRTATGPEIDALFNAVKLGTNSKTSLEVNVEIHQSSSLNTEEADRWAREVADEAMAELVSSGLEKSQTEWKKLYQANYDNWVQSNDGLQFFRLTYWVDDGLKRWDEIEYPVSTDKDVQRILIEGMEPSPQHPLRTYVNLSDPTFSKWRSYNINRVMKVGTLSRFDGHQWGWTKRDYRLAGIIEPELAIGILLAIGNPSNFSQLGPNLQNRDLIEVDLVKRERLLSDTHPDYRLRVRSNSQYSPPRTQFRLETRQPNQHKKRGVIDAVRRKFSNQKPRNEQMAQGASDSESTRDHPLDNAPYSARFEYSFDSRNYMIMHLGSVETREPKAKYVSTRSGFNNYGFPNFWKVSRESSENNSEIWIMRFKNVDLNPDFEKEKIFAIPSPTDYTIEDVTSGRGVPLDSIEAIRKAEEGKLPTDNSKRFPLWLAYLGILSLALGGVFRFMKSPR